MKNAFSLHYQRVDRRKAVFVRIGLRDFTSIVFTASDIRCFTPVHPPLTHSSVLATVNLFFLTTLPTATHRYLLIIRGMVHFVYRIQFTGNLISYCAHFNIQKQAFLFVDRNWQYRPYPMLIPTSNRFPHTSSEPNRASSCSESATTRCPWNPSP